VTCNQNFSEENKDKRRGLRGKEKKPGARHFDQLASSIMQLFRKGRTAAPTRADTADVAVADKMAADTDDCPHGRAVQKFASIFLKQRQKVCPKLLRRSFTKYYIFFLRYTKYYTETTHPTTKASYGGTTSVLDRMSIGSIIYILAECPCVATAYSNIFYCKYKYTS
jgi:hypothetical protein